MAGLTEIEKKVLALGKRDHEDKDTIIGAVLLIECEDIEDEVSRYLNQHPDATFQETFKFMSTLFPPLEIVDDDELEDDE